MFPDDGLNRVAGFALLLLGALVVLAGALTVAAQGDANVLARGDVEELLRKTSDNQALYFAGIAVTIAVDSVVSIAVAVLLYLLFAGRSRVLALLGAAGVLGGGIAALTADAGNLTLGVLAADFVDKGGAGDIAAGDPVILQSARAVALLSMLATLAASSSLSFGLLALGLLLVWAPRGDVNPPRWMGVLALISALGVALGWIMPVDAGVGLTLAGIGWVVSIVFVIALGAWLLARPEVRTAAA